MIDKLLCKLDVSKTPYHAVREAETELKSNGFIELKETEKWRLAKGGKYYVIRDGSALVAFRIGENYSFTIVASHTDSPCFKLKLNAENASAGCVKLDVEKYGGGLLYTWLDAPLKIAGRIISEKEGRITSRIAEFEENFVIPSVAIHFNRNANDGIKFNPQVDMQALAALGSVAGDIVKRAENEEKYGKTLDYDLFLTAAQKPFPFGFNNEFVCSPRVDNLTSVFASVSGIINCAPECFPVIFLADNEEVGSRTKQGAGSTFLKDVLYRINSVLGKTDEDFRISLGNSFLVSCDNAHAVHPNHPELSDPDNKTLLGGGVVIKHHANQNYTTDAFSSAAFKYVLDRAGVKRQDFFMRSDLPSGGTLGAISSSQVSVRSVDIGMPQLAMHSYAETFAAADYLETEKGLTAFLSSDFSADGYDKITVK